jgi:MYXO-CTERM domain-containing protein
VRDANGATATATVTVGPGVSISPAAPAVAPNAAVAFSASGGSGTGYAWTLLTNGSGASLDPSSGSYHAGAKRGVDTVGVTDSLGNTASVEVSVGGAIVITPSAPSSPPLGAIAFSAVGGAGAGYTWSIAPNASGASIDASTGAYRAGATTDVTDVVLVVDPLGNTASAKVTVGAGVVVAPASATVASGHTLQLTATGGSGTGFVWTIPANASGAMIGADGTYTAGPRGGADTVKVTDSLGNSGAASITVTAPPPSPSPSPSPTGGLDAGADASDVGTSTGGGGGCGCRAAGVEMSSACAALAALAAAGLVARRLRRRRNMP